MAITGMGAVAGSACLAWQNCQPFMIGISRSSRITSGSGPARIATSASCPFGEAVTA